MPQSIRLLVDAEEVELEFYSYKQLELILHKRLCKKQEQNAAIVIQRNYRRFKHRRVFTQIVFLLAAVLGLTSFFSLVRLRGE